MAGDHGPPAPAPIRKVPVVQTLDNQTYYATKKELELAEWRASQRDRLKAEFMKKYTNPMKGVQSGGYIFDPAMQRFMSMKVSMADHYKVTPKNAWMFLATSVIPVIAIYKYICWEHNRREKAYRSGEVSYDQRQWKHG